MLKKIRLILYFALITGFNFCLYSDNSEISEFLNILDFFENEEKTCQWIKEYHIITDLINKMGLIKGCEIGVGYGLQSKYFLENCPKLQLLYSIDPYLHFETGYDDIMNLSQKKFEILFHRVKKRLSPFGQRSILMREKSNDAARHFKKNSLDFVYIDGNHSYSAVTQDLNTWWEIVRPGGLISGDDYTVFPTTKFAVDRFVDKNNITLLTKGNKWWFIKPERLSSEPYISGDTFRKLANHTFDNEYIYAKANYVFEPDNIKLGDIIFISTTPEGNLKNFFLNYHPKIKNPYILITHNGDGSVPGDFMNYLDDPKLFAWFGQNSDITGHSKFIPIPIGLENILFNRKYKEIIENLTKDINQYKKKYLLYANFTASTNRSIRDPLANLFSNKGFCYFSSKKSLDNYLIDVCSSKFILSPHGNGLDCHRTWEALYLGTFPVVLTSTLDKLYEGLPVVIVKNWEEVTEEFLEDKYVSMHSEIYNFEKMYFDYWEKLIYKYQQNCKNSIN